MGTAMPARRRPSGMTPILFSRGVPPGAGDCILLSFICIFLFVSLEVRRKKDAALTAAPFQKAWERDSQFSDSGGSAENPRLFRYLQKPLFFQFPGGQLGEVGV